MRARWGRRKKEGRFTERQRELWGAARVYAGGARADSGQGVGVWRGSDLRPRLGRGPMT